METLYDISNLCKNEIRLIGTLTELDLESYDRNDTLVVKYKGVVKCNNAFITIKSYITNYDATIVDFVRQFNDDNVIGNKVYIIGRLNSINNINVTYMSLTGNSNDDWFTGELEGIILEDNKVLIVNNEYHQILNVNNIGKPLEEGSWIAKIPLKINPLIIDSDNVIVHEGNPPIIATNYLSLIRSINEELVGQAMEEHEIYLEAMKG